ncbi:Uncharacterized protein HZ326_18824 [Fusarium oxysporum f. sp. albedinis]|nr:Uncharacterized protein HZ326_18824 [Fusarium oxysporum f. sp. albedinis]
MALEICSPRGTSPKDVAANPVWVMLKGELSVTPCDITPVMKLGRVSSLVKTCFLTSSIIPLWYEGPRRLCVDMTVYYYKGIMSPCYANVTLGPTTEPSVPKPSFLVHYPRGVRRRA